MDTDNVTRFEVVDHRTYHTFEPRGRVWSALGVSVDVSLQDDGRTLKVFLTDHPTVPETEVRRQISEGLKDDLAAWEAAL